MNKATAPAKLYCVTFSSHTSSWYEGLVYIFDGVLKAYFKRLNPATFFIATALSASELLEHLSKKETQRQMDLLIQQGLTPKEEEVRGFATQRLEIYIIPVQTIEMSAREETSTVIEVLRDAR